MSKGRLEEVVKNVVFLQCGLTGAPMGVELPEDDYWYLYEQAERVHELEQQNKRYQKAIKECLERMNEGGAGTRSFVYEKLIEALEGEK